MRNISDKNCRENFRFNNFFYFRKSCRLWNSVEKYVRAKQTTNDTTVQELCTLN